MSYTSDSSRKACVRCKNLLPLGDFNRSAGRSDGLHSYCRKCQSEYRKAQALPALPLPRRPCAYCKQPFAPRTRSNIYCKPACKQRATYWRKNPPQKRACVECGADLTGSRRDKRFCSIKCASKNRGRERPEIKRRHDLKKKYGLTLEAYDALLESQGGVCAICGTNEVRGFGKHMAIDHCHEVGCVRGVLCGNCNRGIGAFGHKPERLEAAIRYLKKE